MTVTVLPDDRALVIETDDPRVLATIPTAEVLAPGFVCMPHDIDTGIRLALLGIDAPSPIEHYYSWPRELTMVPEVLAHQRASAGFLIANPHSYCLNGIGTGKTLTSLWAADYLMEIGAVHRALINVPLSTLERVWGDALYFNFRHRTFNILHGSAERRKKLLAQDKNFYVLNHDGSQTIQRELEARDDIDLIIVDELAVYRNKHNKWKSLHAIIYPEKKPAKPWVWGMTATPTPQEPTDAYCQCRLVTPTTVPKFFGQFRAMVMSHESQYIWVPRQEATKIVYDVMRPAIRFTREQCVDLPETMVQTRDVAMSPEQQKHYKAIQRELFTEIRGAKVTAVNTGVQVSKLLQIACGVVYDSSGVPQEIDAGNRINTLLEIIEGIDEKVIVFVPFTEVTNMLYREISKHWSCAVVYGDVPKAERDQIFGDFQSKDDPSVLIAHPACMAHGLTLTKASTIIWYAPVASNDIYQQSNGRITRIGQRYTANIINLAGSAIERKIYKKLVERQSMQSALLDMIEKGEDIL